MRSKLGTGLLAAGVTLVVGVAGFAAFSLFSLVQSIGDTPGAPAQVGASGSPQAEGPESGWPWWSGGQRTPDEAKTSAGEERIAAARLTQPEALGEAGSAAYERSSEPEARAGVPTSRDRSSVTWPRWVCACIAAYRPIRRCCFRSMP